MSKPVENKYKAALDAAGIPWPGTPAAREAGCICVRQRVTNNSGIQLKYDCGIHGKLLGTLTVDTEGKVRLV